MSTAAAAAAAAAEGKVPSLPVTATLCPKPRGAPPPSPLPSKAAHSPHFPPVQVPPPQFGSRKKVRSFDSRSALFWSAIEKVKDVHSSLDEYLGTWFGLDQSKYQWALDDYYRFEDKITDKQGAKSKEANYGQVI